MFTPFFALAAVSPTRQASFRRAVVLHLLLLGAITLTLTYQGRHGSPLLMAHVLLSAGIVEGALLVGWRLTQIPKSQALEFLLVSPLQPSRVFLGESLVGLTLLTFVTLSGAPVLALLAALGHLDPLDLAPLLSIPLLWGAVTGLGLTVWAYESRRFRKAGEVVLMGGVLLYLVVGVLAGENLRHWVDRLPEAYQLAVLRSVRDFHEHNPFGTMHAWFTGDLDAIGRRLLWFDALSLLLVFLLLGRASRRLQGHFHERHYDPVRDVSGEVRPPVGDRPLSWWAVKRVSEYSGRVNLWLAGGFGLLYASYMVAEAHWPAGMGRRVFQMCDLAGGPAAVCAALVVLAAVPAAFQYGLWDQSAQDRCRRLELLLLTDLRPRDYWDAALAAAWARGRGYFAVALGLWLAAFAGGRIGPAALAASVAAGAMVWALYFALGFRAFARGAQANGLALLLTLGLPLASWALGRAGLPLVAGWLPPGMVYRAAAGPLAPAWLVGPVAVAALTLLVARTALAGCDAQLRRWYDVHHGSKVLP
ncbi:MAG: hypothetical protein U0797_19015 [Gemmataceae bacterium]